MATQAFIGEIRAIGFNFAPRNWAFCNGQVLSIQQNQALFSILGTTYGGNGTTTFALPDLRSRTPLHFGQLLGGSSYTLGQVAGAEGVTLIQSQMPVHNHLVKANANANVGVAANAFPAGPPSGNNLYGASVPGAAMDPNMVPAQGGSQPHPNLQPYLVVNYIICLVGIFPSRN
jgi:microcystin-dependent protein